MACTVFVSTTQLAKAAEDKYMKDNMWENGHNRGPIKFYLQIDERLHLVHKQKFSDPYSWSINVCEIVTWLGWGRFDLGIVLFINLLQSWFSFVQVKIIITFICRFWSTCGKHQFAHLWRPKKRDGIVKPARTFWVLFRQRPVWLTDYPQAFWHSFISWQVHPVL